MTLSHAPSDVAARIIASRDDRYPDSPTYVGPADAARLIRGALKAKFPGVTFSVTSKSYSGGSSIRVAYDGISGYRPLSSCYCSDGPTVRDYDTNRCATCGYIGRLDPIYRDGMPHVDDVKAVVDAFGGKGFDGMIDLSYYTSAWLLPDGSVTFAGHAGTSGSVPAVAFDAPSPDAVRISVSSYLFVDARVD